MTRGQRRKHAEELTRDRRPVRMRTVPPQPRHLPPIQPSLGRRPGSRPPAYEGDRGRTIDAGMCECGKAENAGPMASRRNAPFDKQAGPGKASRTGKAATVRKANSLPAARLNRSCGRAGFSLAVAHERCGFPTFLLAAQPDTLRLESFLLNSHFPFSAASRDASLAPLFLKLPR